MKKTLIPLFAMIWLFACNSSDDAVDECASVTMCTMEFRIIGMRLNYASEEAFRPDSIYTIHKGLNKIYQFDGADFALDPSQVTVVSDAQMEDIDKNGSELELVIMHQNQELAREIFLVGHDCCHITKLSGPTELQLNL